MENEETNLDTAEKGLTFKEIVLNHVNKISQLSSVEFRGGYWQETIQSVGGAAVTNRKWIGDSREIYSNAVEYLYDLLFIHFDDDMKKEGEVAEKKIDKLYDEVLEDSDSDKDFRIFKSDDSKSYFKIKKREISRELFRALCCFLNRKGYLKTKGDEE